MFFHAIRERSQIRENMGFGPALSTGLVTMSPTAFQSQPNSTTSLSGPFSSNISPYVSPTTFGHTEIPPLQNRLSSSQNIPYNPQEWGPVSGNQGSRMDQIASSNRYPHQIQNPEDLESPPPPPYSRESEATAQSRTLVPSIHAADLPSTADSCRQLDNSAQQAPMFQSVQPSVQSHSQRPFSMVHIAGRDIEAGQQPLALPRQTIRSSSSSRVEPGYPNDNFQTGTLMTTSISRSSALSFDPCQSSSGDLMARRIHVQSRDPSPIPLGAPPASRRAVSADTPTISYPRDVQYTGGLGLSGGHLWQNNLRLPGPPPGPPPASVRSSSASGVEDPSTAQFSRPVTRQRNNVAPTLGTRLEQPPPTPNDWVNGRTENRPVENATLGSTNEELSVERSCVDSLSDPSADSPELVSSSGLSRSSAKRDSLARGLRERKNARRSRPERISLSSGLMDEDSIAEHLGVVPQLMHETETVGGEAELTHSQTPTPTGFSNSASTRGPIPPSAVGSSNNAPPMDVSSSYKSLVNAPQALGAPSASTPPLSPGAKPPRLRVLTSLVNGTPKNLPTPLSPASHDLRSTKFRPISHILHLPNDDEEMSAYLSPQDTSFTNILEPSNVGQLDFEKLINESLIRHRNFLMREKLAQSNDDRLQIFLDYILAESRLRREWYADVWDTKGFDATAVWERMFERTQATPDMHCRSRSTSGSAGGLSSEPPTPATSFSAQSRTDGLFSGTYQPALSPIASMSNGELSSRGRTSTRWWESQTGSDSGGLGGRIHRTKRESKYMGLQREIMNGDNNLGDENLESLPPSGNALLAGEKANLGRLGFYEVEEDESALPQYQKLPQSALKLDVSRFITLPPPFPRHFPAVSNSHPVLASYRAAVRTCSDLGEVEERRSRNITITDGLRKDHEQKRKENQDAFRANIQAQIADGSISYAEAAEAEEAMKLEEQQEEKRLLQAEYNSFQDIVLNPLHDMLNERVTKLTSLIHELQDLLNSEAETANLDQTQEEGDEAPHLLEKLTQLKWLFDARELLHHEIFQLLSDRNERYKKIVLLPYQRAGNSQKVSSTEEFFTQDYRERKAAFRRESLGRYSTHLRSLEDHIRRGVELQSSTYWDIVPGLLDLLQQIPEDLRDFEGIMIPEVELVENPSYHRHPLQYLYSIMSHAEKSCYQFIESQINLQCLLHGAKTAMATARSKHLRAECQKDGGSDAELKMISDAKLAEDATLTTELRQTTDMIEQQWWESLGRCMEDVKRRVKARLTLEGGWDEMEQEEVIS